VQATRVRLRPLLLPAEHGGWSFLLEPVLIGLVAAPSPAGALLVCAALGAFLARHPLWIAVDDWRRGRRVPRTRAAWAVTAGYLAMAACALAWAAVLADRAFWPAILLAAAPASVQIWFDARGQGRSLAPELAGAKALGGVAAAMGAAAGLSWPRALALWALALIRVLPAIVTVRERVRRLHGHPADERRPMVAHLLATSCAVGVVAAGLAPWGVALVALLLAGRAAWDLRPGAPGAPALRIGIRELITGLLASAIMGALFRWG
jgi:uncharacterized membrane protein